MVQQEIPGSGDYLITMYHTLNAKKAAAACRAFNKYYGRPDAFQVNNYPYQPEIWACERSPGDKVITSQPQYYWDNEVKPSERLKVKMVRIF